MSPARCGNDAGARLTYLLESGRLLCYAGLTTSTARRPDIG
jgi:hypothetical protein